MAAGNLPKDIRRKPSLMGQILVTYLRTTKLDRGGKAAAGYAPGLQQQHLSTMLARLVIHLTDLCLDISFRDRTRSKSDKGLSLSSSFLCYSLIL